MEFLVSVITQTYLLIILPVFCKEYDRIFDLDNGDCYPSDSGKKFWITQYQTYLVVYDGSKDDLACELVFQGKNDANVETTFDVCFSMIQYDLNDCPVGVTFIDGFSEDFNWAEVDLFKQYTCDGNQGLPDKWCNSKYFPATLRIYSSKARNSKIQIEVTAIAGTSLSVAAAWGISIGCIAFVSITSTLCVLYWYKKRTKHEHPKPQKGRVIRSPDDTGGNVNSGEGTIQGTRLEEELVVGYPRKETEMVLMGDGKYKPKDIMVQRIDMAPSYRQNERTASANVPTAPVDLEVEQTFLSPGSVASPDLETEEDDKHGCSTQFVDNDIPHHSRNNENITPSAPLEPPPSYEEHKMYRV